MIFMLYHTLPDFSYKNDILNVVHIGFLNQDLNIHRNLKKNLSKRNSKGLKK